MTSRANSLYDLTHVLTALEDPGILGPKITWTAENASQATVVRYQERLRAYATQLAQAGILRSMVSWSAQPVNDWFAEDGLDIELTEKNDPDVFYAGAICKQHLKWAVPGKIRPLRAQNGETYRDAVLMDEFVDFFTFGESGPGVARLTTQSGDFAYMMVLDRPSDDPFSLLHSAQLYEGNLVPNPRVAELQFPMAHVNIETDLSYMIDLRGRGAGGRRARLIEAKQQFVLKLNHMGALTVSGTGVSGVMEAAMVRNKLIIDQPFLFWVSRPGFPLPLSATWVDYDDWKNPGELE